MSSCNRGCGPCYSHYIITGGHDGDCCGGGICHGSRSDRMEAERLREQQSSVELARERESAVAATREALEELRAAVTAALIAEQQRLENEAECAREELARLARRQEEENLAAQTRDAIESRLAQLRERKRQEEQPKEQQPKEQQPKVVHVKADEARPATARNTERVMQR